MQTDSQVCIVGAGAAGLWAAGVLARRGLQVLMLEKTARTGTKILASGGSHCNLTTTLDSAATARAFRPAGERFLRHAMRVLPPQAVRERFAQLGVETVEAALEKVFPKSGRARDVRDALELEARKAGVAIRLQCAVQTVARAGARWRLGLEHGESVECAVLFLCSGGASYPKSGTSGDGYAWLRALDLPVVDPLPALVPLTSPASWVHDLAGISCQDCETRLLDAEGQELGRRRRPVLFTHRGVSGPGAMDLSVHVARHQAAGAIKQMRLLVDLLPDWERLELRENLIAGAGKSGSPAVLHVLGERVPRRLLARACKQAGLAHDNPRLATLSKSERHALIEALKGFEVPIDGTTGFEQAEVTSGGLALTAVDPGSMRVRAYEQLYVLGELLDLDGPIGGFSFQAAFACAEVAARAVSAAPA